MDTTDTRVAELLAEWIEAEVAGHRLGERLRALRLEQERLAKLTQPAIDRVEAARAALANYVVELALGRAVAVRNTTLTAALLALQAQGNTHVEVNGETWTLPRSNGHRPSGSDGHYPARNPTGRRTSG